MSADALLLIAVCLLLGWLVARFADPPDQLAGGLNWWVLNIALPALVLELMPEVEFNSELWYPPVAMWLVFLGAWGVAAGLGKWLGWSRGRIGAVTLIAGLGNTAFAGYPLIEALRGKEALPYAVIADQLGGAIALAVGGIGIAAYYSGSKPEPRVIIRRIVLFPAFLALVVGLAAKAFGGWPAPVSDALARIGYTLTPVALFSIGLQLNLRLERSQIGAVGAGLVWKLALAPLLVYFAAVALDISGPVMVAAVLQAAMSPMVSSAILAQQYKLDTDVAAMALGVGLLISLVSVPWGNQFLSG